MRHFALSKGTLTRLNLSRGLQTADNPCGVGVFACTLRHRIRLAPNAATVYDESEWDLPFPSAAGGLGNRACARPSSNTLLCRRARSQRQVVSSRSPPESISNRRLRTCCKTVPAPGCSRSCPINLAGDRRAGRVARRLLQAGAPSAAISNGHRRRGSHRTRTNPNARPWRRGSSK